MSPEQQPGQVEIPVVWSTSDELRIEYATSSLVQFDQESFVISIGQISPPVILPGTEEEVRQRLDEIPFVECKTISKFSMSESKMREFVAALNETLANYERQRRLPKKGEA